MDVQIELFGTLRDLEPGDRLQLAVDGGTVADLRQAVMQHAEARWSRVPPRLLMSCAFATPRVVLRDNDVLPPDGRMVLLPPVSGG